MMALMGASGAGQTTLLDVLAGRKVRQIGPLILLLFILYSNPALAQPFSSSILNHPPAHPPQQTGHGSIQGSILVNGRVLPPTLFKSLAAYVDQNSNEVHSPYMTAGVRLPPTHPPTHL